VCGGKQAALIFLAAATDLDWKGCVKYF